MKNKLFVTSMSTLIGLYGVLIIFLIPVAYFTNLRMDYFMLGAIGFLVLQFLLAPFFTDLIMRYLYKADFNINMPDYLVQFINQVCTEHNMKYPKIGYITDGAPNAFTYGRTKNDARIVLTKGIFDLLTPDEVKSVVAHEMGHAIHYDMLFMTVAQIIPLLLRWVYEITINSSDNNDKDSGSLAIVGLIAFILHIISEYVILWFSRTREYYADEFSVRKTKNPFAMSNALVKVGYGLVTSNEDTGKKKIDISSVSALGIFDKKTSKTLVVTSYNDGKLETDKIKKAARWELWNPWATWYELHSTHPRISKRLKAISKMAPQYNQSPYIVFDEVKPESYSDDFAIELFIKFFPYLIILVIGLFVYSLIDNGNTSFIEVIGIGLILLGVSSLIKLRRAYKNDNYKETKVSDLLGEVKVSQVTSVPCTLTGTFIGRGTPGYIFSEDFVLKDETGIVFIDYKQPLSIMNIFFGIFKAKNYINKNVTITGWYKRSPVPYVELNYMVVDGIKKKCYTYGFIKVMTALLFVAGLVVTLYGLIMY